MQAPRQRALARVRRKRESFGTELVHDERVDRMSEAGDGRSFRFDRRAEGPERLLARGFLLRPTGREREEKRDCGDSHHSPYSRARAGARVLSNTR